MKDEHLHHLAAQSIELANIHSAITRLLDVTDRGNPIEGSRACNIARPLIWGGSGRVCGWSVRAAGGDMIFRLRAGHDSGGDVIADVYVPTGTSSTVPMNAGPSFGDGLFADYYQVNGTSGVLTGAVYIGGSD